MITFDESEYLHSPLSEDTLRVLLNFVPDIIPREVYDQLLYSGDKYVRVHTRHCKHDIKKRVSAYNSNKHYHPISKAKKVQKKDTRDAAPQAKVSLFIQG